MRIYYTLDGSTPTSGSTLYTAPVALADGEVFKFITVQGNCTSEVGEADAPECPPVVDYSGPLDQAIYVASEDKIFGVRGQWLYQFNATTGERENSLRWVKDANSEASITECAGKLYVTAWSTLLEDANLAPFDFVRRDIFEVDFGLVAASALGLASHISANNEKSVCGFSNLVSDGTKVYGFEHGIGYIFSVDPANLGGFADATGGVDGTRETAHDLAFDADNNLIWQASAWVREVNAYDTSLVNWDAANAATLVPAQAPVGVCWCPANSCAYAVTATGKLVKVPFVNFATRSIVAGIDASLAARIKYNAVDGLLYIPNWAADTVQIVDPNTDTLVDTKTGFTSPFDAVFTPTKKFAVQNSRVGLLEIT